MVEGAASADCLMCVSQPTYLSDLSNRSQQDPSIQFIRLKDNSQTAMNSHPVDLFEHLYVRPFCVNMFCAFFSVINTSRWTNRSLISKSGTSDRLCL
jgi:hypothetical protein